MHRTIYYSLVALAFTFNALQALVYSNAQRLYSSSAMLSELRDSSQNSFSDFFFGSYCVAQYRSAANAFAGATQDSSNPNRFFKLKADGSVEIGLNGQPVEFTDVVMSGANPVLWAELSVLILVCVLVALSVFNKVPGQFRSLDLLAGVVAGTVLFVGDQLRYYNTSVAAETKSLFTWSSYCLHGDLGWFFDAMGYLSMYAAVGLGVAVFSQALSHLKNGKIDITEPKMGQKAALDMVCRMYTWLPYFSYMGFAVWVACTQINENASQYYGAQAILVTAILVVVWGVCSFALYQVSKRYDEKLADISQENSQAAYDNPVREFLDPFGSKAFNTLIKILLPLLTLLAIWYKVLATFVGFSFPG